MKEINLFKFLWQFVNKKKFLFASMIIFGIIIEIFGTFVSHLFDAKIYSNLGSDNFNEYLCFFFILIYAIFYNIHHFCNRIRDKIDFESIQKTQMKIRNYLFNYTIQHSMNYFNNSFSGDLNDKINNFVNDFGQVSKNIYEIIIVLVSLLLTPLFYANINIYLSLLFIIIAIIYIFSLKSIKKEVKKYVKIMNEAKSRYISQVNDDLMNIINIKAFASEELEKLNIAKKIQDIDKVDYECLKVMTKAKWIHFLLTFSLFFLVISFGGVLLVEHKIDFGQFIFITIIVSIMRFCLDSIIDKFLQYSELVGRMENSLSKILQPIEIVNKNNKKISITDGKIVFKNITFNYKK